MKLVVVPFPLLSLSLSLSLLLSLPEVVVVVVVSLFVLFADYMIVNVSVPITASTAGTNHGNEARYYKLLFAYMFNLYSSYACGDDGR